MGREEPIDPEVEFMFETLNSIFEVDPQPNLERQRTTRKHSALSMELDAFDRDPDNILNRPRAEIVSDLRLVIEEIKAGYE